MLAKAILRELAREEKRRIGFYQDQIVTARNVEAEAALRAATHVDPTFADAWYNLSDLLDEQGRIEAAIECLRTTLRVAPRQQITGVAISPAIANPNGLDGRADH